MGMDEQFQLYAQIKMEDLWELMFSQYLGSLSRPIWKPSVVEKPQRTCRFSVCTLLKYWAYT
jgi:hypothetical protein